MVPPAALPSALQTVALLLPATHSMRAFEALGGGAPGVSGTALSVGVLAASAVLSFVLAAVLFQWDTRASQPSRKALAALVAMALYVAAALIG